MSKIYSWEELGSSWLEYIDDQQNPLGNKLKLQLLVPSIKNILQKRKFDKVLEIGCGEGELLRELFDTTQPYEGVDINRDLLEAAEQRCSKHKKSSFRFGDAMDLPYFREFGLTISCLVLPHIELYHKALDEQYRVTAAEGIGIIAVPHPYAFHTGRIADSESGVELRINTALSSGEMTVKIGDRVGPVKYYRRTPSEYFNAISGSGFRVLKQEEPMMRIKNIEFPYFLVFDVQKGSL